MTDSVWKTLLQPGAEHFQAMTESLLDASDEELADLERACRMASTTNCGWSTYRAAQYLAGEITAERWRRERRSVAARAE